MCTNDASRTRLGSASRVQQTAVITPLTFHSRCIIAAALVLAIYDVPVAMARPPGQNPAGHPNVVAVPGAPVSHPDAAAALGAPVSQPTPAPSTPANDDKPYVVWLPLLYYTPETRLALGAGGMFGFWLGRRPADTRPSSLPFVFVYTQNKQTQLLLKPEIYLPGNAYLLTGLIRFERMPQKFYGIGHEAAASVPELYTPQTIGLQASFKKRVSGHVWAGVQYEFERTSMREVQAGGLLAGNEVPGSQGGVISGLGLSVNLDTRDNVLSPRRGRFFHVAVDRYSPRLGSDFSFTGIKIDLRAYRAFRESDVGAVQVYVKSRGGAPPFYQLAFLGGDSPLRGYYRGRYRDTAAVVAQAEYRAHIWKRVGAAAFAGLGEACPGLDRCSAQNVLPSLGGGLRVKLNARGSATLRIDYAAGLHSRAFYMTVQEAF